VTAPQAGGAGRSSAGLARPTTAGAASSALLILLLLGLALRLTIAYVLLPGSGFATDIGSFAAWADRLAAVGPGGFYAPGYFVDYPPGYMYVLWLLGGLSNILQPAGGTSALVKLPAMLADVGVAFVLYHIVRGWLAKTGRAERLALLAAGIYLFNPVTWYDSAVWGQTDGVGALVIVLGLAALIRGNSEGAFAMAVLAAMVKPQFGVVLAPLVVVVLLKRHLFAPGSGPRNRAWLPAFAREWFEEEQGPRRLISAAIVGTLLLFAMIIPFGLDIPGLIAIFARAAGGYEFLTINAYNIWALIGAGGGQPLVNGGYWNGSPDTVALLGPLPGVVIGALLLGIGFVIGLARAFWRDDRRSLVVVAAFLALAFFILPTRVHERYLFPVYAVLPILAVMNRRWLLISVILAIGSFINLHGVLTTPLYATDNLKDLPLGEFFREPLAVMASVVLHVVGFVLIALELRPSAALAADEEEARLEAAAAEQASGAAGALAPGGAAGTSQLRALAADTRAVLAPIFAPVSRALSLRRDRSSELAGEGAGRLNRLDLLLLVLIFVAALGLRTFRLEQPYDMHFDEVYHARTATEFLQYWRYGIPHSIYEWTHPHMAKYLIAGGITLLGDNKVVGTRELGTPVKAAAIEQRWAPPGEDAITRDGDRLYVATGTSVDVYDLANGAEVATIPGPADALAVDNTNHELYIASSAGDLSQLATANLDRLRSAAPAGAPVQLEAVAIGRLANLGGPLTSLTYGSNRLVALTSAGDVISIGLAQGIDLGRTQLSGAAAVAVVDAGQRLVVDMSQVTDLNTLVTDLASFTGIDANVLRGRLAPRTGRVTVQGYVGDTDLAQQISDAGLTGASVEQGQALAIGNDRGITFIDAETLDELTTIETNAPVTGFALVDRAVDTPTLYAATGNTISFIRVPNNESPTLGDSMPMPGTVTQVLWNSATELVHALGRTPDGRNSTVYVIEPHANSVFADARLDVTPAAVVLDTQPDRPSDNRNNILAFSADGTQDTVDVGSNAFGWRFMGVLAGALMAACLYLLVRFLFRRRIIAVFAAILLLLDGMAFANARIAMNDTYVAFFIVAALTVFVPLWLGRWRNPLVVGAAIVAVAVLLGLALASKWVGAYAMGGVVLLVLLRSALGRLIALVGMVGLTALLGYVAIQPDGNGSLANANVTFLILMIGLTCLLAVAMALRPMRLSKDELRFAVWGPVLVGALLVAVIAGVKLAGSSAATQPAATGGLGNSTLVAAAGVALIVLGALVYGAARLAARFGSGPLAAPHELAPGEEAPSEPPAAGWLRPGGGLLGMTWLASLVVLIVLPLVLYIWSYAPWIAVGGRWSDPNNAGVADQIVQLVATPVNMLVPGLEQKSEANTGQTFIQLQLSMYDYHNNLRAKHPASSPWWAWPLDLKPVWFQQGSFVGDTASSIYDSGNIVIFWLAIPAFAFICWQAWKRRSLALTFVALTALSLWLPWARIDRATFQYHFFTTLPFTIVGLAYFLAELYHGPSPPTWLLARASAALAIVGPALLWLFRLPLCGLAGTQLVNPGTEACGATARQLALSDLQVVALGIAVAGLLALAWLAWSPPRGDWIGRNRPLLMPFALVVVLGGLALTMVGAMLPGQPVFQMGVGAFELPLLLVLLVILAVPAYYVLRARDPRRFAISALVVAGLWFVIWYPNFSGLPVPSTVLNLLNNVLSPTYNWGFQFAVNLSPPSTTPTNWTEVGALAAVLLVLAGATWYAARSVRRQHADERALALVDTHQRELGAGSDGR
jgi:Gpi18-like mannosyltransferase